MKESELLADIKIGDLSFNKRRIIRACLQNRTTGYRGSGAPWFQTFSGLNKTFLSLIQTLSLNLKFFGVRIQT